MLRILQLNSARKYVGEAAHTLNLTEALRRRGHSVWLGLRSGFETIEKAQARKLDPVGFHMPHRWWPPQDGPDIRHIAKLVREHKIELIHAHRGKDHWQAVLAVKLFRLNVPVVRTRHVVTPLSGNPANRWLAKRTAAMVVVSKAVEVDVAGTAMYGSKTHFIPGGIDLDLFKPAIAEERRLARERLKLAPEVPVAICVARFAMIKAHEVLLAAWKIVQSALPNARLLLVGGGHLMEQNILKAHTLGVKDSVMFLGKRDDVPELLSAADLGVLSSIGSEGFSRAVLEYMSKGLPTVGTRVGAVPDLIEHGVNGWLVPHADDEALGRAILEALTMQPEQRQALGRAARKKAERGYGFDAWARKHEELYIGCQGAAGK
ncbi:MAG TPA: glycosyltransferase family 4 protein [Planctomycetota bacterium]|nr:glycosyltransferase family 4 protein [Planctomycetota bacterium]